MGFNLNKSKFRDTIKLHYDWPVDDIPSTCVCGNIFTVDHAMICKRGGFVTQRHNELRDLDVEADLLSIVCSNVKIRPILQDVSGEQLGRVLIELQMRDQISTPAGSGRINDEHPSM